MASLSTVQCALLTAGFRVHSSMVSRDGTAQDRIEALVTDHFDVVWRYLRRFGLSEADAEEAAQEVFIIALRKLASIDRDKERGFLFGTARHVAATRRRSVARRYRALERLSSEPVAQARRPDELTEQRQSLELLDAALNQLTFEQREVFVLFELEDMSAPAIAELLGVPIGTVASRLHRARKAFTVGIAQRIAAGEATEE